MENGLRICNFKVLKTERDTDFGPIDLSYREPEQGCIQVNGCEQAQGKSTFSLHIPQTNQDTKRVSRPQQVGNAWIHSILSHLFWEQARLRQVFHDIL